MGITINKETLFAQLVSHLRTIYPEGEQAIARQIMEKINAFAGKTNIENSNETRWDQSDVILITYGNSILNGNETPLAVLKKFVQTYLKDVFSLIHVLPFFPYSSDDGFSVIDYMKVDPELGDWSDIRALKDEAELMVDLVINHVSRESLWFADYIADKPPGNKYFIELPKDTDVSLVTRPRSSPLLVPVNTHRGIKYLWATFSDDQIDLNFENPDVLLTFIDIFLAYIEQGARIIRLDAITFLWKTLGTT